MNLARPLVSQFPSRFRLFIYKMFAASEMTKRDLIKLCCGASRCHFLHLNATKFEQVYMHKKVYPSCFLAIKSHGSPILNKICILQLLQYTYDRPAS